MDEDEESHKFEHSIEVQLPFLQFLFPEVKFVPICMGFQDLEAATSVGKTIKDAMKTKDIVVIASTDFSHYVTREEARRKDGMALEAIDPARYEVDRAARRHHRVEPENRLVAAELERRWEAALQALQQAEEALTAGDAELALRYYPLALEHAPEDSQLVARYAQAKEEHTRRLIDELLKQSQQAQDKQDWEAALDAIQRALQLAPNDPALLNRLAAVKDATH